MNDLLISIDDAIRNKNFYAALFISLTLPDICGKIQFPEIKSQPRYIDWFNLYLKDIYIGNQPHCSPFLTGNDLYAFRCSLLHEGSENISTQSAKRILTEFILIENGPHLNLFYNEGQAILQLNIVDLCKEICGGVKQWLKDFEDDPILIEYRSRFVKIYPSGTIINGIKFS
jgi:hypothetical protein